MAQNASTSKQEKVWAKQSIYKVPNFVKILNEKAYKPQMVSFGPYHHDDTMKEHKERAFTQFLAPIQKTREDCRSYMRPIIKDAASCYSELEEKWEQEPEEFLDMLILDGCFMLEVILGSSRDYSAYDPIFSFHGKLYNFPVIRRDMLLIENQIPFLVLEKLMEFKRNSLRSLRTTVRQKEPEMAEMGAVGAVEDPRCLRRTTEEMEETAVLGAAMEDELRCGLRRTTEEMEETAVPGAAMEDELRCCLRKTTEEMEETAVLGAAMEDDLRCLRMTREEREEMEETEDLAERRLAGAAMGAVEIPIVGAAMGAVEHPWSYRMRMEEMAEMGPGGAVKHSWSHRMTMGPGGAVMGPGGAVEHPWLTMRPGGAVKEPIVGAAMGAVKRPIVGAAMGAVKRPIVGAVTAMPAKDQENLNKLILQFCTLRESKTEIGDCLHVLDIYRKGLLRNHSRPTTQPMTGNTYVSSQPPNSAPPPPPPPPQTTSMSTIRCAEQLHEAGIEFQTSSNYLDDISFNDGILNLPVLVVDDATESTFLNLVAFERLHVGAGNDVTSYIFFMDNLINSANDVSLLSKEKIVLSIIGSDEDVAEIFNKLSNELTINPVNCLREVRDKIREHCRHRRNRWRANLMHNYCNSPWRILSLVIAFVYLGFAVLQTIFLFFKK